MDGQDRGKPQLFATLLGFSALFLWAMSCYLFSELEAVPTFQVTSTVLTIAFVFTSILLTIHGQWRRVKQPKKVYFIGFVIIFVNQASFIYAIKLIPPEQAEVIYYLWPIMTIVISAIFFENKSSIIPVFSAFLGLGGVYILLMGDGSSFESKLEYIDGYLFAFAAGLAWVFYSLFARYNPRIPIEMNGIWCGLSALACILIHFYYENTVVPSFYEWFLMCFIGVFILVFSLKMWALGMRFGHFNVLTVFSYVTPLVSVLILMFFDKTRFHSTIILACQFIVLGGVFCSILEWATSRKKNTDDQITVKDSSLLDRPEIDS